MWRKDLHYYGNQRRELLIFAEAEVTREGFSWVKALTAALKDGREVSRGTKAV